MQDADGPGWAGFSLGEGPSQTIVASKMGQVPRTPFVMPFGDALAFDYRADLYNYNKGWQWPEGGDAYYGVPALDISTDGFGRTQDQIGRRGCAA